MIDLAREQARLAERIAVGRICRCGECMCCEDYKAHMAERERAARAVKHTVVCMHKSNYVPVAKGDRETLKQLTRPGRGLGG